MEIYDTLSHDEKLRLLADLDRLTRAEKIKWEPKGGSKDGCVTTVRRTRYEIASEDDDGLSPFRLNVFNVDQNSLIATILSEPSPDPTGSVVNEGLKELWQLANRYARRSKGTIERMFADLEALNEDQE